VPSRIQRMTQHDTPSPSPVAADAAQSDIHGSHDLDPAAPAAAESREPRESGRARFRRRAHRSRLHSYAILSVALVAFLIALAVSNTAAVKVSWVFGSSHVSLVWLVLFAAILGWLLGLAATAAFHWRTRAPRRGGSEVRA
jgi:uncharacterized integral membrane protein